MMTRTDPVWLITGCSTGFGRQLARLVLARGWSAVVTARNATHVADIAEGHGVRTLVLPPDVANTEQVHRTVAEAKRQFGRIDVLVDDAGYGYLSAAEEADSSITKAVCPRAWLR